VVGFDGGASWVGVSVGGGGVVGSEVGETSAWVRRDWMVAAHSGALRSIICAIFLPTIGAMTRVLPLAVTWLI